MLGMDLFIERRKKNDPNAPWEELFYARKFWELLHASFVREYNDSKNSCYVEARINSEEDLMNLLILPLTIEIILEIMKVLPVFVKPVMIF